MDPLTSRATEIQRANPSLPPGQAYRLALEADPALARAHHHGELDQVPPSPPAAAEPDVIDPGALLLEHQAAAGCTFAEACVDRPDLAEAWHEGRMVARPTDGRIGAPAEVHHFEAPFGGLALAGELRRVPIFRQGSWNGRSYTSADLDSMVEAAFAGHYEVPLKLGHDDSPAVPAVGRITRLWREGGTLYADFVDIAPEVIEGIRAGRWLTVSCEVFLGMERDGRKYRAALRAVSLLGGHPPGVDLPPLRDAIQS